MGIIPVKYVGQQAENTYQYLLDLLKIYPSFIVEYAVPVVKWVGNPNDGHNEVVPNKFHTYQTIITVDGLKLDHATKFADESEFSKSKFSYSGLENVQSALEGAVGSAFSIKGNWPLSCPAIPKKFCCNFTGSEDNERYHELYQYQLQVEKSSQRCPQRWANGYGL